MALIGEQFEYGDEICGAVLSLRGMQDTIAIWTKDATNEPAQVQVLQCKIVSFIAGHSRYHIFNFFFKYYNQV